MNSKGAIVLVYLAKRGMLGSWQMPGGQLMLQQEDSEWKELVKGKATQFFENHCQGSRFYAR